MNSLPARSAVVLLGLCCALSSPAVAADKSASTPAPAARVVIDPAKLPAPKRIVVPKLRGALKIDGELDERVWAQAVVLGPFVLADGSGGERERTIVRAWYDDTALHLGWTCTDVDVQATFTARDSKFWEEEVAEFFITRSGLARYYELQWNPLGGEFDAIIDNTLDERGVSKGIKGDWSYTARGMRSAVKLRGTPANSNDKDELWQVEVSIPFADLGERTPQPGDVWRGNFYRFNRTKGMAAELLSWSAPMLTGFHQPVRFGFIEFGR